MALPLRCNAKIDFIVIGAAFFVSTPNCSTTDEVLTQLTRCTGYISVGPYSVGPRPEATMALPLRCYDEIYFIVSSAISLMSCASSSSRNIVLTKLYHKQDV